MAAVSDGMSLIVSVQFPFGRSGAPEVGDGGAPGQAPVTSS